jgi:hypothetical protein
VVRQLRREFRPLHVTIETVASECQIHFGAVASCTARYGVLNVIQRILAQELMNADFFSCIQAFMILFFPQLILQNVGI